MLLEGFDHVRVEVLEVGDDEEDGVNGGEAAQDDALAEGDFEVAADVVAALEGDFISAVGGGVHVLDEEVGAGAVHFFHAGEEVFVAGEDVLDVVFEINGEGFLFHVLAAADDGVFEVEIGGGFGS